MVSTKVQKNLRDTNTIIVQHRSLIEYLGYKSIENSFKVPIFGNRALFQAEERSHKKKSILFVGKSKNQTPKNFQKSKKYQQACNS